MKKLALLFGVFLGICACAFAQGQSLKDDSSKRGWMTDEVNGGVTFVNCGESLEFYDNKGPGATNYSSNRNIWHTIKAPTGTQIRVTFSEMQLGSGSYLDYYYRAYTGSEGTMGTRDGRRSGSTTTAITSTGNVLTFHFTSTSSTKRGWKAIITVIGCLDDVNLPCGSSAITIGGDNIYTGSSAYSNDIVSERVFSTSLGSNLTLQFTDLPDDGTNDKIEVYNGSDFSSLIATVNANSSLSRAIVSNGNVMAIKFISNGETNGAWSASIEPDPCFTQRDDVELACGATQEIGASYTGAEYYATTYMCNDPNARLIINMTSLPNDHEQDYLEIFDGDLATGSRMGRYCGDTTILLYSSSNKLTVMFRSNNTNGGSWSANVSALCPQVIASPADIACGASYVINETNAEYGNLQYTRQVFRAADANARLVLDFTALPEDSDHDKVLVYDGEGATATLRGIYYRSGSTPSAIYSSSNVMTIEFLSNESVTGTWGARVSAICIDDLDEQSLGCDGAYAINSTYTNLQYTRQVFRATDPDAQVHLDFAVVNGSGVLPHDNANDYVEVYDGEGASMTLIGRYYGFGRPRTVSSVGPVMTVIFMSNSTVDGTWSAAVTVDCPDDINMPGPGGGHAEYTTCNATVYDDGGDSNNPGYYSAGLDNEYIVLRAGRPESVLYLEGEYNFDWQNDWITIYDGEPRIENGEPVFDESKILWGGGHHGHGHSWRVHPNAACYSGFVSNATPADGSQLNAKVGNTCVTYYPRVTSKTGSLTIRFHTNNSLQCEGFEFHTYCIPKPTDCYSTGEIIFRQDFGGNSTSPLDPIWIGTAPPEIASACTYEFRPAGNPGIGHYSLRKFIYDGYQYYNYLDDHTHPGNIDCGYLFQGDHDGHTDSYFYKGKIPELNCNGADKLMVSLWAANINNEWHLPGDLSHFPNLEIEFFSDEACTHSLTGAPILTGPIPEMTQYGNCSNDANEWQFYYAELTSPPAGDIWFRIINSVGTTAGNDFVLDDIEVRACLPPSILTRIGGEHEIFSSANVCAGEQLRLKASLDETLGAQSRYPTPYYAWERGEEVTDPNDPNYPIRWTRMNFGDYGREGEWATCDVCERLAFTNGEDISYGAEDNYENYNDITIVEVPSPTAPAYTHYYYRVIVAGSIDVLDYGYCRSISEPYEIIVTRIPEIEFGGTNAICEGGQINLSITPTSPTPGTWTIESEWQDDDQNMTPPFHASLVNTATGYQILNAVHDSIVVKYTTSPENGGCYNTKTIPIYPLPNITITPPITTICEGRDIVLHPRSDQESSFQWRGGGPGCSGTDWAADSTCADWRVYPEETTTYIIDVTTTHNILDEDGVTQIPLPCVSDASKVVTVLPKPIDLAVAGIPVNPVCPGTSVTLTPSATGSGTGTLYYSWDGITFVEEGDDGFTLTVSPSQTTDYTLYVKEVSEIDGRPYNCEPAELAVTVNVYTPPVLSVVSYTSSLDCYGVNEGEIQVSASGGNPLGEGTTSDPHYYEFSLDNVDSHFSHNETNTQFTFNNLPGGEYTVYVRDRYCRDSEPVTITQPTTPFVVSIYYPPSPTCYKQATGSARVQIDSGGTPDYAYSWNTIPQQTTATASNLAQGTYVVTVYDSRLCPATASVEITSIPVPEYTISGNDLTKCLSSSATDLTVTLDDTNPVDVESYSWSTASGTHAGMPTTTTGADLNSIRVTPDAAGTYTYTVVITADNECTVSSNFSLIISEPPTIGLASGSGAKDQTMCYSKFPTTFAPITFTFGGGATGVNFQWTSTPAPTCLSYDAGTKTISATATAAPTEGATYTYSVVTTTAAGNACAQETIEGTITIRPQLTVSVTADHTACEHDDIGEATALGQGGNPGTGSNPEYTYLWNNTETTATIDELQAGTYSVVVTDGAGCSVTNSVVIEEKTNPTISILKQDVRCYGETSGSIEVTVTNYGTTAGTSNPYTDGPTAQPNYYVFSTNNGTTTVNSSGEHYEQYTFPVSTNGEEDSYTYNIYVRDGNGCTVREDVEITQPALLTATFTSTDTTKTCQGQSVGEASVTIAGGTQFAAPNPSYNYAWNTYPTATWDPARTTQAISDLPEGSYCVTVTDALGCVATATVAIEARPVPSINASTTADAVCLSSSTSTFSILNNNTLPITSHSWSVDPTTGAGLPANLNTASLTVTPTGINPYEEAVTYVYTDVIRARNGCEVSGTVSLTVNPTAILTHKSGDLVQTLCFEKTLTPIVFEYSGGATGFRSVVWSPSEPDPDCLSVSIVGNTLTISEGTSPVAGEYRFKVQANGAISPCSDPFYDGIITIHPELAVSVSADHQSCVTGNIGVATATVSDTKPGKPYGSGTTADPYYYNYVWTNSSETTATISNLAGNTTYTVTVSDANECTATSSVAIIKNTNPEIEIADVETVCPAAGTVTVSAGITTETSPDYIYRWTNDGSFAVTTTNPLTTDATSVTATVTVPNASCSQNYTLKLQVEDANNCLSNIAEKVVTVADVTTPTISPNVTDCQAIPVTNCKYKVPDVTGLVTVNDECVKTSLTVTQNPPAGTVISSTQDVTVTVSDGCEHSNSTTISVVVPNDVSASIEVTTQATGNCPIASGEDYEVASTVTGGTDPYTYSWTNATAVENHTDQATFESDGRCHTYNIILSVNDSYGCVSTTSVEFATVDDTKPTITCPSNISVNTDLGTNTAAVTVPLPTNITDNCTVDYYRNNYTNAENASATYNLGTTTVTYTVYDMCGNDKTCTFTVTVTDNEPPCIGCDPDPSTPENEGVSCTDIAGTGLSIPETTDTGEDTYTHHGTDWDITATDNVHVASITYTVTGNTHTTLTEPNTTLDGQVFGLGTTTVTWTVL
ncbi:MAG: HYR domain-containing protein, partial [Bacteroidales bacterium]|nr:HYR domain-containing protein [Bacteroidales bacterium]